MNAGFACYHLAKYDEAITHFQRAEAAPRRPAKPASGPA